MKIGIISFPQNSKDAAGSFLKDMERRADNVEDAHEDGIKKFSKYHNNVVKNIEKELNRSKRL